MLNPMWRVDGRFEVTPKHWSPSSATHEQLAAAIVPLIADGRLQEVIATVHKLEVIVYVSRDVTSAWLQAEQERLQKVADEAFDAHTPLQSAKAER